MLPELIVAVVVEAFDGGVFDRAVHPLNLTVRPGMARLRETVLDVEVGAGTLEGVAAEQHLLGAHRSDLLRRPRVAGRLGEMRAVIGEHGVDLVGNGGSKGPQEIAGDPARDFLVQLGEGELGGPIDGHEQVKPAFFDVHLSDIDVEVADRVPLELCTERLVAPHLGEPRDAMALQATVQA